MSLTRLARCAALCLIPDSSTAGTSTKRGSPPPTCIAGEPANRRLPGQRITSAAALNHLDLPRYLLQNKHAFAEYFAYLGEGNQTDRSAKKTTLADFDTNSAK